MAKNATHTVGLDIGTSRVTCIIGEPGDGGHVDIVGIGEAEARGLRKGVVVRPGGRGRVHHSRRRGGRAHERRSKPRRSPSTSPARTS